MSREIKFRGKTTGTGEWVYGNYNEYDYHKGLDKYIITTKDGLPIQPPLCRGTFSVIPETVGQYTGLKDKNGVEIYEGDIVQFAPEDKLYPKKYVVGFDQYDCSFSLFKDGRPNMGLLKIDDGIVVVGNIYENKELLENEKTN